MIFFKLNIFEYSNKSTSIPTGKWYIVANHQKREEQSYQITEFVQYFDEMEDEKIHISDDPLSDNKIVEWIDIKSDTDKLTNREIMLAIKWYIRGSEESDEDMQLDNQFEKLSISSHSDISQNDDHYGLFEDPFRSLLWRPKSTHLTFSEKRWIYMHYKNTCDSINTISQRTGASISTIRRIILSFSRNVKRSEIFSKIRWNRLIDSKVVSKSISKIYIISGRLLHIQRCARSYLQ